MATDRKARSTSHDYPACFEAAKAIIDNCQGSILECVAQSKCTLCSCLGSKYCPCTGIA